MFVHFCHFSNCLIFKQTEDLVSIWSSTVCQSVSLQMTLISVTETFTIKLKYNSPFNFTTAGMREN